MGWKNNRKDLKDLNRKLIIYLTYNDLPSGIYSSQVIDVVKFIRNELNTEIRLVAFISLRGFLANKKKIRHELPDAIILPMFPGVKRWRKNNFLLTSIVRKMRADIIIGRSVLATQLALHSGIKKTIYDGRGAIAQEWKEYKVVTDSQMLQEIHELEEECIMKSDHRLAVSDALVKFWKNEYNYNNNKHSVIPCTINKLFEKLSLTEENILTMRSRLGLKKEDVVYIYSGSMAGWQSIQLLKDFIAPILRNNESSKLIFLTEPNETIRILQEEFKSQILYFKLPPEEVASVLIAADYGLLIRENSITNKVASPVKFAEYLACGLKVILSEELGDYSDYVQKNDAGYLFTKFDSQNGSINLNEKKRLRDLALKHFVKKEFIGSYKQIISI